jgi:hypothetical protein
LALNKKTATSGSLLLPTMRVLVAAIMLMQCAAVIALAAIFSVVHEQSTRHKIVAVICSVVLLGVGVHHGRGSMPGLLPRTSSIAPRSR